MANHLSSVALSSLFPLSSTKNSGLWAVSALLTASLFVRTHVDRRYDDSRDTDKQNGTELCCGDHGQKEAVSAVLGQRAEEWGRALANKALESRARRETGGSGRLERRLTLSLSVYDFIVSTATMQNLLGVDHRKRNAMTIIERPLPDRNKTMMVLSPTSLPPPSPPLVSSPSFSLSYLRACCCALTVGFSLSVLLSIC